MSKKDFKDYICRPLCKFFRDGEKKDMACRGAEVVELLIRDGMLQVYALPRAGKDPSLWKKKNRVLESSLCQYCSFRIDGCDFQSESPPINAEPCGGYILISLLLKQGTIIKEDLSKVLKS